MPIKDLVGSPHPMPEQKALLEEVLARCGLPLPKRSPPPGAAMRDWNQLPFPGPLSQAQWAGVYV